MCVTQCFFIVLEVVCCTRDQKSIKVYNSSDGKVDYILKANQTQTINELKVTAVPGVLRM